MSTENKIQLAELNKLSPIQIADNPAIQNKFVKLYNSIHGSNNGDLILEKEKFHFVRQINDNPGLKDCTRLSLYGCFMDVAVSGLSFEGGSQPLIYMIPRKNKNWGDEKRATLMISPYGELALRMLAGQIQHADNPVIVYEHDAFQCGSDRDGNWVKHTAQVPRKSDKIIACYIRIVRPNGSVDFAWLLEEDWKRLSGYSEKQNFGKANALYTSNNGQIDPGFLKAKTIRHAFKTYPKLKTGQFTAVETETTDDTPETPDYGIDEKADEPQGSVDAEEVTAETVTVQTDENDEEGGF